MCVFYCVIIITIYKFTAGDTSESFGKYKFPECSLPMSCLALKNCKPLKTLMDNTENLAATLKFLNGQLCGNDENDGPKVCCPEDLLFHKSIKKDRPNSLCEPPQECVALIDCGPLMFLVQSKEQFAEKIVKFVRSQQCGVDSNSIINKVCCKVGASENFKDVDLFSGEKDVTSGVKEQNTLVVSTTESVPQSTTKTLSTKQKTKILNKFFNTDYFDSWLFELFVRRKK